MLLLLLWLTLFFTADGKSVQGAFTKQGFPAQSRQRNPNSTLPRDLTDSYNKPIAVSGEAKI